MNRAALLPLGRRSSGIGAAAGIGFTVALFITELAFDDAADQVDARLAILAASVAAAAASTTVLRWRSRTSRAGASTAPLVTT